MKKLAVVLTCVMVIYLLITTDNVFKATGIMIKLSVTGEIRDYIQNHIPAEYKIIDMSYGTSDYLKDRQYRIWIQIMNRKTGETTCNHFVWDDNRKKLLGQFISQQVLEDNL